MRKSPQRKSAPGEGGEPSFETIYRAMMQVRLFERFCLDLRKKGKITTQVFPCEGQEALVAAGLALSRDDAVYPSFRSRQIFFGKGVDALAHFRELLDSRKAIGGGREVFHHSTWPDLGVMPGSSMIGGHLPMAAGYAMALKLDGAKAISVAVFGDGTLGSGDLYETMNMAAVWSLPFVVLCENNGLQVGTPWQRARRFKAASGYAEAFGFAARTVDGNDPLDVFQAMRWAKARALEGTPVMLDCMTFRTGPYSSHFGEMRVGSEDEIAYWRARDPVRIFAERMIATGKFTRKSITAIDAEETKALRNAYAAAMSEVQTSKERRPDARKARKTEAGVAAR